MIEKIPHTIDDYLFSLKCGCSMGYSIGLKYLPIWVSVSVLGLNQNRGFGEILEGIFVVFQDSGNLSKVIQESKVNLHEVVKTFLVDATNLYWKILKLLILVHFDHFHLL